MALFNLEATGSLSTKKSFPRGKAAIISLGVLFGGSYTAGTVNKYVDDKSFIKGATEYADNELTMPLDEYVFVPLRDGVVGLKDGMVLIYDEMMKNPEDNHIVIEPTPKATIEPLHYASASIVPTMSDEELTAEALRIKQEAQDSLALQDDTFSNTEGSRSQDTQTTTEGSTNTVTQNTQTTISSKQNPNPVKIAQNPKITEVKATSNDDWMNEAGDVSLTELSKKSDEATRKADEATRKAEASSAFVKKFVPKDTTKVQK